MRFDATNKVLGRRSARLSGVDGSSPWFPVLRRYLASIAGANLIWEFAQLPLYTIWWEGSVGEMAFAAVHCAAGDVLIAGAAFLAALLVLGDGRWPDERYRAVASSAVFIGLSYTVFSEWLNTEVRGSWAYADIMPTLPLIGSGLSPLVQWIVIPPAAFWWARRQPLVHPRPDKEHLS